MEYRQLGNSDLKVSVIGFGAWQLGDDAYWGGDSEADPDRVVHMALDEGINFFDTAELYGKGRSEEVLGDVLGRKRDDVIVASKFWVDRTTPKSIREACEASLKRLGTDYLDLYQVHFPLPSDAVQAAAEVLATLRTEGKIRYIGVSNFGVQQMTEWHDAGGEMVSNQLGYNLLFRVIEQEILPACIEANAGVIAYMPLMQGLLTGRYASVDDIPPLRRRTRHFASTREGTRHGGPGAERETMGAIASLREMAESEGVSMADLAIAWILAQPGISTTIIGGRKPDQLKDNLKALDFKIEQSIFEKIDHATSALKLYFGTNADLWDTGSAARIK